MEKNKGNTSRVKNTLKSTGLGFIVKFVTIFTNFLVRTIFIRYLGIEYTGVSSVFKDVLTVLSFAELGIGSAITYALYKPISENNYKQIAKLMNLYKTAYRMIALFVFFVGMCLIPFLDKLVTNVPSVKESLTIIYVLYIIDTSSSYLLIYKSTLLTANQQAYIISKIQLLVLIIRTISQVAIIVLFKNFLAYLIVTICFTVLQNIIISNKANRCFSEIDKYRNEKLDKESCFKIFKDIKALSLYKISGTVLNGTDSLVISSVLGADIVGYVSNYKMIINALDSFMLQFLNSATASIGNLVASYDRKRQKEMFDIMNFACESFFCVCSVCLFCLLDEFIGVIWLGHDYLISKLAVLLLCFDFFLKGNSTIVNSFRNANGLFVQGQYRPLIMAVINIIISIIAVHLIGLPGVFLGTVISRLTTQVWYDPLILFKYAFKEKVHGYYVELLIWFGILFGCGGFTFIMNRTITLDNSILCLMVHGFLSMILTVIVIVIVFWRSGKVCMLLRYIKGIVNQLKSRKGKK